MASEYNFSIEQGSNFDLALTGKDDNGAILNLSGYSATGQIRYRYGSTGYLVNLNTIINLSSGDGVILVSLTPSQTSALPVTKAVYDIEVSNSGGYAFKVSKGYVDIFPEVTIV